jgi:hypothetical protein
VRVSPPKKTRNRKIQNDSFLFTVTLYGRSDVVIENFKPGSMSLSSSLPEIPTDMNVSW